MSGTRGPSWPVAVTIVGALVLLAGAAWLVWVWAQQGVATADNQASVLGFLLAAAGALVAVFGWMVRRRREAGLPATAEQVQQAAVSLAGMVGEQWDREAQARALGDPEPMPVRWRLTGPTLMDHPTVITPGTELVFAEDSARIGRLTAAFQALPRRRLVIIGGPGTGKTTLAVQLLRELLAHLELGEPVPVLFSLTGWDPDAQPRVQDWLAAQLTETYPALRAISADAAAALAERGRILPILDGLDEVSPVRRAGIIAALNASLTDGVVLTSRRLEYRAALTDAGDVLTAAAVIAPLALTRVEAAAYLDKSVAPDRAPGWDRVVRDLRAGAAGSLTAVVTTPLGLWLVRTVYLDGPAHDRPHPAELIDGTYPAGEALTRHLFDQLIPALVRIRPPVERRRHHGPEVPLRPALRHDPDDLRRWLTTLAEQLRHDHTRDWRWWQMTHHAFPTRRARLGTHAVVGLAGGLVGGLAVGLAVGLAAGLAGGLAAGLVVMLLVGLAVGLGVGLAGALAGDLRPKPPEHANLRFVGRGRELLSALAGARAIGLVVALVVALVVGLAGGLAVGLAVGLADGLARFIRSSALAEGAPSPSLSYQGDFAQSMILAVSYVLAGVLAGGLAGWLTGGLAAWLAGGLVVGLTVGLVLGASNSWFGFSLAATRYFLRRSRRLPAPWRVMAALDDCYRLGLLRAVGPVYQFRHAQLQDHLAPPPAPEPTAAGAPPSS